MCCNKPSGAHDVVLQEYVIMKRNLSICVVTSQVVFMTSIFWSSRGSIELSVKEEL